MQYTFSSCVSWHKSQQQQAFSDQQKTSYLNSQKTMEINPRHPIVIELNEMIMVDAESEIASDSAWLLYDTALLQSGFQQVITVVWLLSRYGEKLGQVFN